MNCRKKEMLELAKRCAHCPDCRGIREFKNLNISNDNKYQIECKECRCKFWLRN